MTLVPSTGSAATVASTTTRDSSPTTAAVPTQPASTEVVVAPTTTAIAVTATNDTTEDVLMPTDTAGAQTLVGSFLAAGKSLVTSALGGFNATKGDSRKEQFKPLANYSRTKEGRQRDAEEKRKGKRHDKLAEKQSLGSPKAPGEEGYVQQRVANVEQQEQVQQAMRGL